MSPVAFTLGPLSIRWYGLMAALGFLAAMMVMRAKRKHAGLSDPQISDIIIIAIVTGILGSRLFYVLQFWDQFKGNLISIVRIDQGGLVYYGGFFLAIIVIVTYCRIKKLSVIRILDVCAPGLALGHAFGRIGCFLNGCCYGKPCSLPFPFSITYPDGGGYFTRWPGQALMSVQLLESAANFLLAWFLLRLIGKLKAGQVFALYFMIYGLIRFADEFLRGDHTDFILGVFTRAQLIGLFVMVPVGAALWFFFGHAPQNPPPGSADGKA